MSAEPKIVVLNIDDLEAQRYVKTRDLKAGGFDVIEGMTGAEALRLVEQHRPPVVCSMFNCPTSAAMRSAPSSRRSGPK